MKLALAAAALVVSAQALACGICIEDKIAAAYDHGLVEKSLARGHAVAFYALDGRIGAGGARERSIRQAAEAARGADPGSARVSLESGSLSVAFDPRRANYAVFEKSLAISLSRRGLSLIPLRVMDRPADLRTARR